MVGVGEAAQRGRGGRRSVEDAAPEPPLWGLLSLTPAPQMPASPINHTDASAWRRQHESMT